MFTDTEGLSLVNVSVEDSSHPVPTRSRQPSVVEERPLSFHDGSFWVPAVRDVYGARDHKVVCLGPQDKSSCPLEKQVGDEREDLVRTEGQSGSGDVYDEERDLLGVGKKGDGRGRG